MAVDLVMKRRERGGSGWAIRSLKLRTSRKLIFAAGLLACLMCRLKPSQAVRDATGVEDFSAALVDYLMDLLTDPPLEILARGVNAFGATEAGADIFRAYDDFLALLDDAERRRALEQLTPEDASGNEVFRSARDIGRRFQDGLDAFFLRSDQDLTRQTLRYGVF